MGAAATVAIFSPPGSSSVLRQNACGSGCSE
jgi:hypothetical protein